jgi:hypothetical protein
MADISEEANSWHRRFAAAANNQAWDLSVQPRNAAEDPEMLSAVHASAWYWAKVGTGLNRMRATMLLAEVHALLGMSQSALAYAEVMRTYLLGIQSPDWELAFVHAVRARAQALKRHVDSRGTCAPIHGRLTIGSRRSALYGTCQSRRSSRPRGRTGQDR